MSKKKNKTTPMSYAHTKSLCVLSAKQMRGVLAYNIAMASIDAAIYSGKYTEDEVKELQDTKTLLLRDTSRHLRVARCTPLHSIVGLGCINAVKTLLELGSNNWLNERDHVNMTVLEIAVSHSRADIVSILLEHSPSPEIINACTSRGTLLHIAVTRSCIDVVRALLHRMSQEAIESKNEDGNTALDLACIYKLQEIERILRPYSGKYVPPMLRVRKTAVS